MDLTGALIIAAISVLIGFLLGVLVFYLRRADPEPPLTQKSASQREMSFWREGEQGHVVVEIDGASYRRGDELDADQQNRLTSLLADLQSWLPDSLESPESPLPSQVEAPQMVFEEPAEEAQRTSLNPFHIFTRSLGTSEKTGANDPAKSIVEQIDDILQENLQGTHLEERGIKLQEGPDRGMVIEVGLNKYSDIDSIPDEAVRQIIRVSIAEWESRAGE